MLQRAGVQHSLSLLTLVLRIHAQSWVLLCSCSWVLWLCSVLESSLCLPCAGLIYFLSPSAKPPFSSPALVSIWLFADRHPDSCVISYCDFPFAFLWWPVMPDTSFKYPSTDCISFKKYLVRFLAFFVSFELSFLHILNTNTNVNNLSHSVVGCFLFGGFEQGSNLMLSHSSTVVSVDCAF